MSLWKLLGAEPARDAKCAIRLSVRTSDFHSEKMGSIPVWRTTAIDAFMPLSIRSACVDFKARKWQPANWRLKFLAPRPASQSASRVTDRIAQAALVHALLPLVRYGRSSRLCHGIPVRVAVSSLLLTWARPRVVPIFQGFLSE